jgi:hypothetical protein
VTDAVAGRTGTSPNAVVAATIATIDALRIARQIIQSIVPPGAPNQGSPNNVDPLFGHASSDAKAPEWIAAMVAMLVESVSFARFRSGRVAVALA